MSTETNPQKTPQPTPQPLTERYEALEQMLGYNRVLWYATFAVWHYEHEVNGHDLAHTTLEPLTGLGQFLTEEMSTQLRTFYEHVRDLGQRSEDTLKRAYTLMEEHRQAMAAKEKKE